MKTQDWQVRLRSCVCAISITILLSIAIGDAAAANERRIDFRRDIRPILSDNCFRCHGPNEGDRQGGFRFDQEESAFGEADSGEHPIVPGSIDSSEMVRRIASDDEDERMPPPESRKSLAPEEMELIKQWIAQGAAWDEHWSFVTPSRPNVPAITNTAWATNDIDHFIARRLHEEELSPTPAAAKGTLLRRLAFDLTGLPPNLEELNAFLADDSEHAYEERVEHYLASPHYGEHQARFWLDAVRYADTHGLHLDNYREMWPYRDWVVKALNDNLPFDQFATQQLAGDLLDDPSTEQLIASGYNRCHVTTNEGGSIEQEVYIRNVVDRVVTTGTVFLGLTLDCTRCHDHKYDPLTAKDFYALSAFFNSMDGPAMDMNAKDPAPVIPILSEEDQQKLESVDQRIAQLDQRMHDELAASEYIEPEGVSLELIPTEYVWVEDQAPQDSQKTGAWNYAHRPEPVFSGNIARVQAAPETVQHYFKIEASPAGTGRWIVAEGDVFFVYVLLDPTDITQEIMVQFHTEDWEHRAYWGKHRIPFGQDGTPSRLRMGNLPGRNVWTRLEVPAAEVGLSAGNVVNGWAFTQFGGKVYWDRAGILSKANPEANRDSLTRWTASQKLTKGGNLPEAIRLAVAADEPSDEQRKAIRDHFVAHVWSETRATLGPLLKEIGEQKEQRSALVAEAPTTLVYQELAKPKLAHILKRGEYDQPGELVSRDTPQVLLPFPQDAPRNRLGLAQWLLDPSHPLTARVTVNRLWQQFFGVGLVKTAEDFGSQGEPPSHPALLDWLAVQLIDDGWDLKRTIKRIVMSSTYRQSAAATRELIERDPQNRLLARGPRYRLDAEMLRDQALSVSGLLHRKLGGPGVKPPQPAGLWKAVGYVGSNTDKFAADDAPDEIHRRTLYTFFKRTAPPPQMGMFDAPSREGCCVRRERTNTPLQALLLLNDPQYLEASKALAKSIIDENHATDRERLETLWRRCTMNEPSDAQREALAELLTAERLRLNEAPTRAAEIMRIGTLNADAATREETKQDGNSDVEWAAWTLVANVVLNADEVLNKN